ncbi:hypothetical protein N665_0114s0071 [Sinapis alba]|nr:hypothetical protein N665_0114s0071 [Sinapis alba]
MGSPGSISISGSGGSMLNRFSFSTSNCLFLLLDKGFTDSEASSYSLSSTGGRRPFFRLDVCPLIDVYPNTW